MNVYYGMEVDVLDKTGKVLFTVSMDIDMKGHIWFSSSAFYFRDLKFTMSNSKVLTEGVAHRSTSNMFYSATSNFIEKYVSKQYDDFVLFSEWDKFFDNKFVKVTLKKTYMKKGLLFLKFTTSWKKEMDAILEELKNNKN